MAESKKSVSFIDKSELDTLKVTEDERVMINDSLFAEVVKLIAEGIKDESIASVTIEYREKEKEAVLRSKELCKCLTEKELSK